MARCCKTHGRISGSGAVVDEETVSLFARGLAKNHDDTAPSQMSLMMFSRRDSVKRVNWAHVHQPEQPGWRTRVSMF